MDWLKLAIKLKTVATSCSLSCYRRPSQKETGEAKKSEIKGPSHLARKPGAALTFSP